LSASADARGERLGHASVGITLDTYSHVLPGLQAAAVAQLDTLLTEPAEADAVERSSVSNP
jgi:integrase